MADPSLQYIPLKVSREHKGKISRKKHQIALKLGDYYPPEGHASVSLGTDRDGEENIFIFMGGSRKGEPATINSAPSLVEVKIRVSEDDVTITSANICKTSGSTLPPLQSHTMVNTSDGNILSWGGLVLDMVSTSQDLHVIQETAPSMFDITTIEPERSATPSRMGRTLHVQKGFIPTGRAGHTLTRIGETDQYVLHGGFSTGNRYMPGRESRFTPRCEDGNFYLDGKSYSWQRINSVPTVQARAFHSAIYHLDKNGGESILFTGGTQYHGPQPIKRLPINKVLVLTISRTKSALQFSLSTVTYTLSPMSPTMYVSYHASAIFNSEPTIVGGFYETEPICNPDKYDQHPTQTSAIFQFDTDAQVCKKVLEAEEFSTSGHSVHAIEDCLLVAGGTSKQLCMVSSRDFEPDPCELPGCNIAALEGTELIEWIDCDQCKKWFHFLCVGLKRSQKKYKCPLCKPR